MVRTFDLALHLTSLTFQVCSSGISAPWCSGWVVECMHKDITVAFSVVFGEPGIQLVLQSPKEQRPKAWITALCYKCMLVNTILSQPNSANVNTAAMTKSSLFNTITRMRTSKWTYLAGYFFKSRLGRSKPPPPPTKKIYCRRRIKFSESTIRIRPPRLSCIAAWENVLNKFFIGVCFVFNQLLGTSILLIDVVSLVSNL